MSYKKVNKLREFIHNMYSERVNFDTFQAYPFVSKKEAVRWSKSCLTFSSPWYHRLNDILKQAEIDVEVKRDKKKGWIVEVEVTMPLRDPSYKKKTDPKDVVMDVSVKGAV